VSWYLITNIHDSELSECLGREIPSDMHTLNMPHLINTGNSGLYVLITVFVRCCKYSCDCFEGCNAMPITL